MDRGAQGLRAKASSMGQQLRAAIAGGGAGRWHEQAIGQIAPYRRWLCDRVWALRRCLPQESKLRIDRRRCAMGDSSSTEPFVFQDVPMSANLIWSVADLIHSPHSAGSRTSLTLSWWGWWGRSLGVVLQIHGERLIAARRWLHYGRYVARIRPHEVNGDLPNTRSPIRTVHHSVGACEAI
jgi:hypothetical protein